MSEQTPCIRCGRAIDAWAKSCPYCNWDQSRSAAAAAAEPVPVVDYKPPEEKKLRNRILMAVGGILLLIVSFGIGMIINRDDTPEDAPPTVEEQKAAAAASEAVPPVKRATTELVPADAAQQTPITTAPAAVPQQGGVPNEYARHDATAVSSEEYRALAARAAEEERRRNLNGALLDPRSITGRAYAPPPAPVQRVAQRAQAPAPQRPVARPAAAKVTRPVPEYQPVPDVRVGSSTTVRMELLVGPDGRVKEVSMRDTIPGQTARIVSAVQRWRFRPATSNGQPVEAPYNVEIWFKADR